MAQPKINMYLSGMQIDENFADRVLRISGVECDSTPTNLAQLLYMDDFSQYESEILHLKHADIHQDDSQCGQPISEQPDGIKLGVSGQQPDGIKPGLSGQQTDGIKPGLSGQQPNGIKLQVSVQRPDGVKSGVSSQHPDGINPEVSGQQPDYDGIKPGLSGQQPDGIKPGVSGQQPNGIKLQVSGQRPDGIKSGVPVQPISTPPIKKENTTCITTSDYAHLPDIILVHIFSYLELKDICRMSLVCRRWHDVAKSPRLWKLVQQSPTAVDDLDGFLNSYIGQSLIFCRPYCMNNNGLQHIQQKCSNIQALWLVNVELADLDLSLLPSSLVSLALVPAICLFTEYDFDLKEYYPSGDWWTIFNSNKFPNLDFLYLDKVHLTSCAQVLNVLSDLVTLTGLRFENSRIPGSQECIDRVTRKLRNLKFLSFAGCMGLMYIYLIPYLCRIQKLTHLRLGYVWNENLRRDLSALTSLKGLKILHLESNYAAPQVSAYCRDVSDTVEMLRHLDMLVVSDMAKSEAMLFYKVVEVMDVKYRRQVSFEEVLLPKLWSKHDDGLSYRIRVIF